MIAARQSCLGLGLGGLGRLHLGGERLGPRQQRLLLLALAPAGSACRAASARPAAPRTRRSPPRLASSAASAASTTSSDSPRLAWAARTRSGSSRRTRGSIMPQGYPPAARRAQIGLSGTGILGRCDPPTARAGPRLRDRCASPCSRWSRFWSTRPGLRWCELDNEGKPAQGWAHDEPLLMDVLRGIERGFGTLGMTVLTSVLGDHPACCDATGGRRSSPSA